MYCCIANIGTIGGVHISWKIVNSVEKLEKYWNYSKNAIIFMQYVQPLLIFYVYIVLEKHLSFPINCDTIFM